MTTKIAATTNIDQSETAPTSSDHNNNNNATKVMSSIPSKKRRYHNLVGSDDTRIQFLTVHFHILQALYRTDVDHHNNNNKKKKKDDDAPSSSSSSSLSRKNDGSSPVVDTQKHHNNNIWNQIQYFMLHQRELLLHIQQRIQHISNIHQAAIEVCSTTSTSTSSTTSTSNSSYPIPPTTTTKTTTTPLLKNSTTIHNNDNTTSTITSSESTTNAFCIITNIIGQQSKMIQSEKLNIPSLFILQELLQEVTRRIESLKQKIVSTQQQPTYIIQNCNDNEERRGTTTTTTTKPKQIDPLSTMLNSDRSYRIELQYKIQLWSLLAHDLKEVLRD